MEVLPWRTIRQNTDDSSLADYFEGLMGLTDNWQKPQPQLKFVVRFADNWQGYCYSLKFIENNFLRLKYY